MTLENSSPPAPRKFGFKVDTLLGLALILLSFAAFSAAIGNGHIWDDGEYLLENTYVFRWSGPGWFWLDPGAASTQWHPMTLTILWVEYHLWGLCLPAYHAAGILLHGLNALLLWRILKRLDLAPAWAIAALFAVHPLAAESVCWIAEQKNLLAMCFGLASIMLILRVEQIGPPAPTSRWKIYALALFTFALSLTSKPVFCGVPVIALLLLWKQKKLSWPALCRQLPFAALALLMAALSWHFEQHAAGAAGTPFAFSPAQRVMIAGLDTAFYAQKFLLPYPLLAIYPRWNIENPSLLAYLGTPLFIALLITLWMLRNRIGRGPFAAAGIAGVALAPALGLISFYPMLWSFVADHYVYFALPAFAALLVAPLSRLLTPRAGAVVLAAALLALATLSVFQSAMYQSGEKLWRHTLRYNPNSVVANTNMANTLLQDQRAAEAVPFARRALQLNPDWLDARFQLANALNKTGQYAEAAQLTAAILAREPNWYPAIMLAAEIARKREAAPH